jgi:pimeloyl-ACP methyl ester carboxylesterase
MRLVFVHGINNQGRSDHAIIDEWLANLAHTLSSADMATIRGAEIIAPYYGNVLHAATTRQSQAGPEPIAQSAANVPSDEAEFYREVLEDMAPAAGVTETQVRAEAGSVGPIEQGLADDRRLLGLARALERVSPWKGRLVLKFLPQAFVYLNRDDVADDVDKIVRPAITEKPCVIVGHSLGTVVTFKLLREDATLRPLRAGERPRISFYMTLGSPLAVAAVKNAIGPIFARPDQVSRWLNGLDRDDAVTIGRSLKDTTFGPGIENIDDIDNGDDAHDVSMYLRDRRVAEALVRAVAGG